jgi:hypothetical protein
MGSRYRELRAAQPSPGGSLFQVRNISRMGSMILTCHSVYRFFDPNPVPDVGDISTEQIWIRSGMCIPSVWLTEADDSVTSELLTCKPNGELITVIFLVCSTHATILFRLFI